MDGVVENENLASGQGCSLIFQAATHLVAVLNFPTFSLRFTTRKDVKEGTVYTRLRATVLSAMTRFHCRLVVFPGLSAGS